MFGAESIEIGFYVAQLVAIGLGLWLALSLERIVSRKLMGVVQHATRSARILRISTWLGLGYLLALPFLQILQVFHSLVRSSLPQFANTSMARIAWGTAPGWLWTILNAVAMFSVYAIVVALASPRLKEKIVALDPSAIDERMATIVIFSGASIVWNAVNMLVSNILMLEIPSLQLTAPERGVLGFVGGWLVAVLIILTLGLFHSWRQANNPAGSIRGS